jgi:hypothetical protein
MIVVSIAITGVSVTAQDRTAAEKGGSVAGFVRLASGEPIANARVWLRVRGGTAPPTTRTAVDGSYLLEAIPAGDYEISVSAAGAVAKSLSVSPGAELRGVNFSIPDGGSRRVVTGRVVMNEGSRGRPLPSRLGVGFVLRTDGTLVLPLAPGDQRVFVRLPDAYFVESATYGPATVYSRGGDGRRLPAANFAITVPPEPRTIPELVVTLGVR